MKHIPLFEQFLLESNQDTLTHQVLKALETTIDQMVLKIKENILKEQEKKGIDRPLSARDLEGIRIGLIIDLLKSFEKWTLPTDRLQEISAHFGSKGLEIRAQIQRDGVTYPYWTEAIFAGGWNIQKLHYRYLTKTGLPKILKQEGALSTQWILKQKRLQKGEKLQQEIQSIQQRIEQNLEKIKWATGLSSEERIEWEFQRGGYSRPTWQEIQKRGADKNYPGGEQEFLQSEQEYLQSKLRFFQSLQIDSPTRNNQILQKVLQKLEQKLEQLG